MSDLVISGRLTSIRLRVDGSIFEAAEVLRSFVAEVKATSPSARRGTLRTVATHVTEAPSPVVQLYIFISSLHHFIKLQIPSDYLSSTRKG